MSFCNCDDPAPQDFYRKETRTARKRYRCGEEECRTIIQVGTRYVYIVGKSADYDERSPWDIKMCLLCDEAWQRLEDIVDSAQGEVCRCLGKLHEAISEAFDNSYMEGMQDDVDVRWLMENGYISRDAFAAKEEETIRYGSGYLDYTDERQLVLIPR